MDKAIFIDRDGTLNEMVYDESHGVLNSPRRADQVLLMPHAAEFLRGVKALGYKIILVTNQPAIAKGNMTERDLAEVNARLAELLREGGGAWDEERVCKHHPDGGPTPRAEFVRDCDCRKPKPGMLLQAAREHGLDLAASWMLGDGLVDVQAGRAAGCRTILVTQLRMDHIEKWFKLDGAIPDFVARDLGAALQIIRDSELSR
jgi:histidinol-phosphate phosphatase family protein